MICYIDECELGYDSKQDFLLLVRPIRIYIYIYMYTTNTPSDLSHLWTAQSHWVERASDSSGHHRGHQRSEGHHIHIYQAVQKREKTPVRKKNFAQIHI